LLTALILLAATTKAAAENDVQGLADHLVEKGGTPAGICAVLRCGDGGLAVALAKSRRAKMWVYTQDARPDMVAVARKAADAAGLLGKQDNNPVSTDTVLKWPYLTQWMDKPYFGAQPRTVLVSGGRIITATGAANFVDPADAHLLQSRNAFNGTLLWTRRLDVNYPTSRSAFVATPSTFYMIDGRKIGALGGKVFFFAEKTRAVCLDATTGSIVWTNETGDFREAATAVSTRKGPSEERLPLSRQRLRRLIQSEDPATKRFVFESLAGLAARRNHEPPPTGDFP